MKTKHVAILVPNEAVPASIVDPNYIFSAVNQFVMETGSEPAFEIQLVGLTRDVPLTRGLFSVRPDALIGEVKKTDLVIVPALSGDIRDTLEMNRKFIPWIVRQHRGGAEVASLCLGAFLLAATGLLNGRECSTHWLFADQFRSMFPEVRLVDGRIISDTDGLYSSGGASSYWNLLLHIVEKYVGREVAIRTSKFFAIEIDRKTQSPFIMFQGQKKHEDEPIKQAQEYIEHNVGERISVEALALKYAIGRRHFERRFKKATNNTPVEYIQRVKMEAAKKFLENSPKNVTEVMYEVGYTDVKAFRTVFRKVTGLSPIAYRNKYNRQAAV